MNPEEAAIEPTREYEWSDVDGGFAFVRNELIIPVGDLWGRSTEAQRKAFDALLRSVNSIIEVLLRDGLKAAGLDAFASPPDAFPDTDYPAIARDLLAPYDPAAEATLLNDNFVLVRGKFDVVAVVGALRALGVDAQPNHVFMLHDSCCCGPHPAAVQSGSSLPLVVGISANPKLPVPKTSAKLSVPKTSAKLSVPKTSAKLSVPKTSNELTSTGGACGAVKAAAPAGTPIPLNWGEEGAPRVVVLDTGMPMNPIGMSNQLTPWPLANTARLDLSSAAQGAAKPVAVQQPDFGDNNTPPDGFLDESGGHGGFIAGIIERRAPGTPITLIRVIDSTTSGFIIESDVAVAIRLAVDQLPGEIGKKRGFISMSFGGPVWKDARALADAVAEAQHAGAIIVASAGNDATCEPQYPAALPKVVAVGALGPDGPADFTNYGSWVRCCAPGVDVVSNFFTHDFDAAPTMSGDPDEFEGWAMWSGTSFAAPAVVAALLRDMAHNNHTAQQAVDAVIDAPHLGRIPGLGTVVNI